MERMIIVVAPADEAEYVADQMWRWGVRGIAEVDLDDGQVELTTSVGRDDAAIARALASLRPSWRWRVDDVDTAASDEWKRYAEPVRCRHDLVVAPAWYDDEVGGPDDLVLRIDPGGAFGLGDHPTTRSSLRALADELDRRDATGRPARSVLDVGCGSGALSVLAARRGVPGVRAIDISDSAIAATRANAVLNDVGGGIVADSTPIGELYPARPAGYDVIVANILAPVLVSIADDLHRLLADDGTLIVSGVLAEGHGHGHRHVIDALHPLAVLSTIDDEGWSTITLSGTLSGTLAGDRTTDTAGERTA